LDPRVKLCGEKYIFIAFYLLSKCRIDGPIVVVSYRKMELFLNKGICVLTDSKLYVFQHCTNTKGSNPLNSHYAFSVLNISMGIGYIKE
jgi:hypothetical protein